jgi:hypothetical protein
MDSIHQALRGAERERGEATTIVMQPDAAAAACPAAAWHVLSTLRRS